MKYRIEFYSASSGSWLAAHHDFDCDAEYASEADANDWISNQNSFELSEGENPTSFRVESC